jgi:hypothetical protein
VVEGAILHHENDDVLDLVVRHRLGSKSNFPGTDTRVSKDYYLMRFQAGQVDKEGKV